MGQQSSIYLPTGYALTLAANASSSGHYYELGNPGDAPGAVLDISAGTSAVIGPFLTQKNYAFSSDTGNLSYSINYAGDFSASNQEVLSGATLTAVSPTTSDNVLIQDASDNDNLKTITIQNIIDTVQSTPANRGTAAAGVTVLEYGDSFQHTTKLTVNKALPAITGTAAQGVGILLYTLPAGAFIINMSKMDLGITQSQGNINADTPSVGLGTVLATGAIADLTGTGLSNLVAPQTATNSTGTHTIATIGDQVVSHETAGAHTVYFNAADAGWAAGGDAAAVVAGTVILHWQYMN